LAPGGGAGLLGRPPVRGGYCPGDRAGGGGGGDQAR